jgi:hypothetical protein
MKSSTDSAMANVGGDDKDSKIVGLTSGMARIVAHPRYSRPLEFKPLSEGYCERLESACREFQSTNRLLLASATGIASDQSMGDPPCKSSMDALSLSDTLASNLAPASINEALPHPAITSRSPEVSSISPLTQTDAPPFGPSMISRAAETSRFSIRHFSSSLIRLFRDLDRIALCRT